MKSDQWKIFTVAYYHAVELNAGARDASSTCDADTPSKASVPAHWCVHQTVELLQRETPKFTGAGLWLPIKPMWIKEVNVIF